MLICLIICLFPFELANTVFLAQPCFFGMMELLNLWIMNTCFQVEVNGQIREVELLFGTDRDLAILTRRRSLSEFASAPHVRDALEFSCLAAER